MHLGTPFDVYGISIRKFIVAAIGLAASGRRSIRIRYPVPDVAMVTVTGRDVYRKLMDLNARAEPCTG